MTKKTDSNQQFANKTVITFGTFDLFHIGHLKIIERAGRYGTRLIVGVSSDDLNFSKKAKYPIYSQSERMEIVKSLSIVDEVFVEESLEKKAEYLKMFNASTLVMGDDWKGKFDNFKDICDVIYLERTPMISTTEIIEVIRTRA